MKLDIKKLRSSLVAYPFPVSEDLSPAIYSYLEKIGVFKSLLKVNSSNELMVIDHKIVLPILQELGYWDLPVGRLIEGHYNALLLIQLFGSKQQREILLKEAQLGTLFGIWNTEIPDERVELKNEDTKISLTGAKNFCSGGLFINKVIITAQSEKKPQMIVLNLDDHKNLNEDWNFWNPMGMNASASCRIDFTGISINKTDFLGGKNDYEEEPWFTAGAIRFSAVQLGAAIKCADLVLDHLKKFNRTSDVCQQQRISDLALHLETGKIWIRKAGEILDDTNSDSSTIMQYANMTRTVIQNICQDILQISTIAIGLQGFLKSHSFEKVYRDLTVYLRQPGPDRSRLAIAAEIIKRNEFTSFGK